MEHPTAKHFMMAEKGIFRDALVGLLAALRVDVSKLSRCRFGRILLQPQRILARFRYKLAET